MLGRSCSINIPCRHLVRLLCHSSTSNQRPGADLTKIPSEFRTPISVLLPCIRTSLHLAISVSLFFLSLSFFLTPDLCLAFVNKVEVVFWALRQVLQIIIIVDIQLSVLDILLPCDIDNRPKRLKTCTPRRTVARVRTARSQSANASFLEPVDVVKGQCCQFSVWYIGSPRLRSS